MARASANREMTFSLPGNRGRASLIGGAEGQHTTIHKDLARAELDCC